MFRRSLLLALTIAASLTALAPAANAQAPRVVGNVAPWVPQANVSPSGNFTMEKARFDCVAADPAAVSSKVRCWTQAGPVASAEATGGAAAVLNTIVDMGVGQLGAIKLRSFEFCAEGTFTYADGRTEVVPAGCVADDLGFATAIGF